MLIITLLNRLNVTLCAECKIINFAFVVVFVVVVLNYLYLDTYFVPDIQVQDQSARFVQPDLNLHRPLKTMESSLGKS